MKQTFRVVYSTDEYVTEDILQVEKIFPLKCIMKMMALLKISLMECW